MKKHNFSAGPAILPASVIQEAAQGVADLNGIGLSIMEISHRSPEFKTILEEAVTLVHDLLGLTDDYAALFLTGGASSQFFMTAMNLLDESEVAGYVDTGSWSTKAIKEAKLFGKVEVLASSKESNFSYIPKGYDIPAHLKYVHLTSNNTIFGTQYHAWPETSVPFVCDMSSDMFSRPIDFSRFAIIYAGAQKNMGPAGTTLVIVKKDLLGKVKRTIPTMLDYETHIKKDSAFNTPPVFPIYVSMLTLKWVKEQGGLNKIAEHNTAKAKIIYDAIDSNGIFEGVAAVEDRSLMNATFVLGKAYEELAPSFLEYCAAAGCVGVKGHRSVGGFRASIYNSMPLESAQVLADVMHQFTEKHG
ncbi:MAG: 3-phosphoserine/phosphohydroxythreonine transaminase [Bacteroidota bacterium]